VIKVLEHESKLYNFEKNFLKMIGQNQQMPQFKHGVFNASSSVYKVGGTMQPY
jgi:hypothetical protein